MEKYIKNINSRIKSNEWIMRGIEVFAIAIWIFFAMCSLSQVSKQIKQIQVQINQWNENMKYMSEQNEIAKTSYEKWKRFEEIKLLQEVSKYFEIEPNRSILEFIRTKNSEQLSQYWDKTILDMLDKFEYLAWLSEENEFKDNDIRVNFETPISIVCSNNFIMWEKWLINKYAKWRYWWLKKLCSKRWWNK